MEHNNTNPNWLVSAIVFTTLILCAFTLAFAENVDVNDMELEGLLDNIVISASKHTETLSETPANVFIITRAMIDDYGCQNIADALSMAPGIYITDDYTLSQIGVRGVSDFGDWNSHVMILVDGRPMNEQYGGTSSIDAAGLDIDNIDRIEVVKGPSSSLYGSNAFFGMINLITKTSIENGINIKSKYGSALGTKATSIDWFHRLNPDLTIHSTGTYLDNNGSKMFFKEYSDISDVSLLTQDDDGYNQYYLDSASFTAGWADGTNTLENFSTHNVLSYKDYSATLHYAKMNTGLAHSAWGSVFNSPENRYREMMFAFDLGYSGSLSQKVDMTARIGYSSYQWSDHVLYNYDIWEAEPLYLPDPIWKDYEEDRSFAIESKIHARISDNHVIVAGGEVAFHNLKQISGATDPTGEIVIQNVIPDGSVEQKGQIYNVYVQSEHQIGSNVKAVGGLHLNHYSYTTGKIMPKAALIVKPYEDGTLKAIVGRGFRSPTFYELTYTDGEFYYANPDLVPEIISSYEFIATHEFNHGLSTEISYNHSNISNLINQVIMASSDPNHPGGDFLEEIQQFQNTGRKQITTAEWSVKRASVYKLSGFFNVTWQKVESINDQNSFLYNSPRWLGNIGVNYKIIPGFVSASLRVNHIAKRKIWDGSLLKSANLVDLSVTLNKVMDLFTVNWGIKNLFDKKYRVPIPFDYAPSTSFERPGRSFYISLASQL